MTDEFKFKDQQLLLKLCGREFSVIAGEETAQICGDILTEAKRRLEKLKCGITDDEISETGICEFLKESVEKLIGIGSVDIIFGKRQQTVSDMADLMCYVVSKIRNGYIGDAKQDKMLD
ncbi:MAG: hypothetical protein IKW62_01590 [Clostridia bacterium]|nr:hypothetical protein [Clostridia bacterium]